MTTMRILGAFALALSLCGLGFAADGEAAPDAKPGEAAGGHQHGGAGGRGRGGMWFGGQTGPRTNWVSAMAQRAFGIDIEDPKAPPKLDAIPLAQERRFVMSVPVAGIDNPTATGAGFKVESLFKLTDEQTKATDALREEYAAKQKELDQKLNDEFKSMAEKVVALRTTYEQRANDILTGPDKETKLKLDALIKDAATQKTALVATAMKEFDMNDPAQGMAMMRSLNEKFDTINTATKEKFLALVPAENKAAIEAVLKEQDATHDMMTKWMTMRGNRGGGPGGPNNGQPVKPPKPENPGNF